MDRAMHLFASFSVVLLCDVTHYAGDKYFRQNIVMRRRFIRKTVE